MKEKIHQTDKKLYSRIYKLMGIAAFVMVLLLTLLFGSYQYYKGIVIKSEQRDILNLVTTVSSQLEVFFDKKNHYLREIRSEEVFQKEFLQLLRGETQSVNLVEVLFKLQYQEYISIELIDKDGNVIKVYTDDKEYVYRIGEDIEGILENPQETYYIEPNGNKSINITHPVFIDGGLYGFVRMKLNTYYVFNTYIADYKLHEKGYISLKDNLGRLLFHPSNEGIGEDVVEVRKRQHPDYDWSELEEIVQRQLEKETGVGMYHSIWPGERRRVKKISAYTPCEIGDTFLIVNLSVDYKDTIVGLAGIAHTTIFISLILFAVGLLIIGYIYRVEVRKNMLMVESIYFNELKEKNALLMHQSKFAAMGEMLATIAHQLKQPLNALKLSLYNIEDYYILEEKDETYLKSLMEGNHKFVDKMAKTIDDFRFFFKSQDERQLFSIYDAVNFALDLNIGRMNNLEVKVHVHGKHDIQTRGESNIFSQVILNLLNNSIDAMEGIGGEKHLEIFMGEKENQIIVEIEDNGGGLQQEIHERLFEPYQTTKGDNGTGIGLYISKIILKEKFSGDLRLENTKNGVKAVIRLPKREGI